MPPITTFLRLNSKKAIPIRTFINIRATSDEFEDTSKEQLENEQFAIPSIENIQRKAIIQLDSTSDKNVKTIKRSGGVKYLNGKKISDLNAEIRRQLIRYLLEISVDELESLSQENMISDKGVKELSTLFPNFSKKMIFKIEHDEYLINLIVSLDDVNKIRNIMTGYMIHDSNMVGVPYHNLLITDTILENSNSNDNENNDDVKPSLSYRYHKQKIIRVKIDLHILSKK